MVGQALRGIPRTRFRTAFALFCFVLLAAAVVEACSSSNSGQTAVEASRCYQNSDCSGGLICALGACRKVCSSAADCGDGGQCIDNGTSAICQSAADYNTPCTRERDCPSPLACASDYRCRNLCMVDGDCNVLGISGRVCAQDANGVQYCAVPSDTTNGKLTAAPPPNAPDTGVMEPTIDATSGDAPATGDGPMTMETSMEGSSSSSGGDGSSGGDAPADTYTADVVGDGGFESAADAGPESTADAGPVCTPACTSGNVCVVGGSGPTCEACGASAGEVCCAGQVCGANLTCTTSGVCECGSANQSCCGGSTCNSGLSCNTGDGGADAGSGICTCGELGSRCCPGVDGGAPSCSGGGVCSGSKCSCIMQYAPCDSQNGVVLRSDGTVWANGGGAQYTEMSSGTGPLRATAIAASKGDSSSPTIGCAIVSGGVWCFPTGGTLTDSTFLGAGLGPADSTSSPVQVLTPTGTPLANVTQLVGGLPSTGNNFCAVTSGGSAWCWGIGSNGQLGNGGAANSNYATQVMSNASTPFTNVGEVRMSYEATCARRMDGSVWCWGTNNYSEFGAATPSTSYYPVQVMLGADGGGGPLTATRLGAGRSQTFCAIQSDTSLLCWGYNMYGQAGAPASSYGVPPTQILTAAGGTPLTGVVDVAGGGPYTMCAKTSALTVLCWGTYPVAYQNGAGTGATGIIGPLAQDQGGVAYIDPSGVLERDGTVVSPQPTCANLLP